MDLNLRPGGRSTTSKASGIAHAGCCARSRVYAEAPASRSPVCSIQQPSLPFHRRASTCMGDGGRLVRVQRQHSSQSWVRENMASPFCAMTEILRFARATAGRPYSEHRAHRLYDQKPRDHQGAPSLQGFTEISRTGEHKVCPNRVTMTFSMMRFPTSLLRCGH